MLGMPGSRILPAVGHFVVPVLETDNGEIIQDSGDIIDFLEQRHAEPLLEPQSPVQQWVSLIFDAFGSEYLLPLAMHYRWSYRDEQETFLRAEFGRAMVAGTDRSARREAAADALCPVRVHFLDHGERVLHAAALALAITDEARRTLAARAADLCRGYGKRRAGGAALGSSRQGRGPCADCASPARG